MRLAAGLNKAEYLGSLPCLFNTEEERFQQRFATLSMLNRPEPLSYSYYRRSMDMTGMGHCQDDQSNSILKCAVQKPCIGQYAQTP